MDRFHFLWIREEMNLEKLFLGEILPQHPVCPLSWYDIWKSSFHVVFFFPLRWEQKRVSCHFPGIYCTGNICNFSMILSQCCKIANGFAYFCTKIFHRLCFALTSEKRRDSLSNLCLHNVMVGRNLTPETLILNPLMSEETSFSRFAFLFVWMDAYLEEGKVVILLSEILPHVLGCHRL